jgi:hypothetical protein
MDDLTALVDSGYSEQIQIALEQEKLAREALDHAIVLYTAAVARRQQSETLYAVWQKAQLIPIL